MRRYTAISLVVASLVLAGRTIAAEVEDLAPGLCVAELARKVEFYSGIPTLSREDEPWLVLCGGTLAELTFVGGKFTTRDPIGEPVNVESEASDLSQEDVDRLIAEQEEFVQSVPCVAEMLYDGQPSVIEDSVSALLVGMTQEYAHGILGDAIEASGFCVFAPQIGEATTLRLEPGSVFEDLRVRLIDLTGDGQVEFVVIRSYLDRGAALAVYYLVEGRIEHLAETPPIGRPNRWLNPAGAADFDGDGRVEIAYVETPHIGGTLRVWELVDGELRQEQAVAGFSNHAIGSRELDLSAVLDWNADGVPDLAVPANGRRSLRIVTFAGSTFAELDVIPHDAEIVTAILATDLDADGKPELLYGLEDGRLMLARP